MFCRVLKLVVADRYQQMVAILCCAVVMSSAGCSRLNVNGLTDRFQASNERDWSPEMEYVPSATLEAGVVTLKNIRHNTYASEDDFVVEYFDRKFNLSEIQSVDYIVVPFKIKQIAHTMLSFGLQDGTYLTVSIEVRKEKGERYNPVLGMGRKFELMYLVGDERDLVRLRTEHRDAQVYVYPSVAAPEHAQALFLDVMERANQLALDPEFYHSIRNNCTTNLAGHVNEISSKKIRYGWRVLLPGLSAKYAYDLGLLDNRIPFEELTELALVNDLALEHRDAADFSQKIRARHSRVARYAELDARFK